MSVKLQAFTFLMGEKKGNSFLKYRPLPGIIFFNNEVKKQKLSQVSQY